jgi:hypothetical protein
MANGDWKREYDMCLDMSRLCIILVKEMSATKMCLSPLPREGRKDTSFDEIGL